MFIRKWELTIVAADIKVLGEDCNSPLKRDRESLELSNYFGPHGGS